ncbi:MAG TPA: TolC family protein [Ferruginibacter sp.]|nr:TolC family protein [Ferruginibacter sp.]HRO05142.1 TolC family protein [Ferruginibacter sp.]HRO95553.1 TolC family protein [Ferruginibacter sp.]HRP49588.1 TolC family protein [Ferruginibacter sp.]
MKKSRIILACLSLFAVDVQAQDVTELTLKKALQYAVQNFSDARKARLDVENAGYQIQEVQSRALPQVTANGGLNYNPLLQKSALPGELNPVNPGQTFLVAFGQKWNTSMGVSVTQNIFDQSVFTGLKAAKSTREFYALNAQLTEELVLEKVSVTYYQLLLQRQQIANIDSNISTTMKAYSVINGLYESGLGKKIDVDRLEVKLLNLQSQRQQLLNAVALHENSLKFLIGMPVEQQIIVPDEVVRLSNVGDLLVADSGVMENRSEIMLLQKQQQLLKFKKESVKAEYYPTLSLTGSYSYQGIGNRFPMFKGMNQGVNWFDVSTIGLNLKIPIFNGFATKARIRQTDVEIRKLQEDMAQTKQSLHMDFSNAKIQLNNSIIILNVQERNADLAQKVLENTNNNYTQGLATLTDLIDAQNALFESKNAYTSGLLYYRLAEIKLLKATGKLRSLLN